MHAFVSKRSEAEEIMKVRSRLFRRPQEEEEGRSATSIGTTGRCAESRRSIRLGLSRARREAAINETRRGQESKQEPGWDRPARPLPLRLTQRAAEDAEEEEEARDKQMKMLRRRRRRLSARASALRNETFLPPPAWPPTPHR